MICSELKQDYIKKKFGETILALSVPPVLEKSLQMFYTGDWLFLFWSLNQKLFRYKLCKQHYWMFWKKETKKLCFSNLCCYDRNEFGFNNKIYIFKYWVHFEYNCNTIRNLLSWFLLNSFVLGISSSHQNMTPHCILGNFPCMQT